MSWMMLGLRPTIISLFMAGVLLICPGQTLAHGDIDEQIISVSKRLEANPTDPELYIKRGDLYRLHQDWQASLADFKQGQKLSPENREIHFYMGRLFWDSGEPENAKSNLDNYLSHYPDSIGGLTLRSRVLAKMNKVSLAVKDISKAIDLQSPPLPDLFIERKNLVIAQGPEHFEEALQGIEEGIATMGSLVIFIQTAMEIEIGLHRYDAALIRFNDLPEILQETPHWITKRGDILLDAGRKNEAFQCYFRSLELIKKYSKKKRRMKATLELELRLARIVSADSNDPPLVLNKKSKLTEE
jgi:tetratricopeptide (TPR) repeat protein